MQNSFDTERYVWRVVYDKSDVQASYGYITREDERTDDIQALLDNGAQLRRFVLLNQL